MIEIVLKDNESGYSVIGDYVCRYWTHNNIQDIVVISLGTSYDGINYYVRNEVAAPLNSDDVEFDIDWWEGEKYVRLFGIKSLNEISITGGIYHE